MEHFQESHDIVEQSACQVADGINDNVPEGTPAEADMKLTSADRMRVIPCPRETVVDDEHILMRNTRFVSTRNVV
jgi:hypothetical protein